MIPSFYGSLWPLGSYFAAKAQSIEFEELISPRISQQ